MGISKVGEKYRARLYFDGRTYNIGNYDTHLKASRAINKKRKELKAEQELDQHVQQIWDNEKAHEPEIVFVDQPTFFERLWRKIKGAWEK